MKLGSCVEFAPNGLVGSKDLIRVAVAQSRPGGASDRRLFRRFRRRIGYGGHRRGDSTKAGRSRRSRGGLEPEASENRLDVKLSQGAQAGYQRVPMKKTVRFKHGWRTPSEPTHH